MKHKKYKFSITFFSVLWLALLIIFLMPTRFPTVDGYYSNTRLHVARQTSAPVLRVLEGVDELRAAIPLPHPEDLDTNWIVMTGKSTYNWTEYPNFYLFDYEITGRYVELTTQYQVTFGTIPIFQADTITPIGQLSDWILVELGDGFFFLLVILFWIFPLAIASLCFLLYRKIKRTK